MRELKRNRRRAFIIVALATLVIVCVFAITRFRPIAEAPEPVVSANMRAQLPPGSIAYQNRWSVSDFFTEPTDKKFCNSIANDDSSTIDELMKSEIVDLNCTGNEGMYPLLWAFVCGRKQLAVQLLRSGANPDARILRSIPLKSGTPLLEGDTFAFTTLRQWDVDMFSECLAFIKDPNQRDRHGDTLLHKLLGQIAFNSAPGERLLQLTEKLMQTGVDVNARNLLGSTPLHIAFINLPEFGPLLLDHGADPTIISNDGKSVLDMYAELDSYLPTCKIWNDKELLRYSAFVDRLSHY